MNITILTYGSRGDVQPFLPLSVKLISRSHKVKLAAPSRFKNLVEGYGIEFVALPGDPAGPIQKINDARLNIFKMLREGFVHALEVGPAVFQQSAEACKGADLIIHAFSHAVDGHTRARELNIPDIHIQTFPVFAPTGDYPSVVLPDLKFRPLNYFTHAAGMKIIWWLSLFGFEQIRRRAGLPKRKLYFPFDKVSLRPPTLILCAWSPSLLPPSAEWSSDVQVTGYFFFDETKTYQPPPELQNFLDTGEPPVCVSFGSMVNREAEKIDRIVREALAKTGQRGIILSGWGGAHKSSSNDLLYLESAPHDWLLPRCKMLIHHGGAGTVAAGLRAGIPQVVVPFMTDQPFWARRVHAVGAAPKPILVKNLSVEKLARAMLEAGTKAARGRADEIGKKIRAEDGVNRAVELVESHVRDWNGTAIF
ncbi:MAG: glycosyltransferase family 1 protein [Anaerolineales bacterium]|nr:glycosyltransferase family 1 protein [Anaerolineales bacterium]